MTSEPRQWSILEETDDEIAYVKPGLSEGWIHVIEYSAYEAMKAERDEWKEAYKLSLEVIANGATK